MKKINNSFQLFGFGQKAFVEYSYQRFGFIKCYQTAVFLPRISEKREYMPYAEDELKQLIFARYGHKVKSIININ